PVTQDAQNIEKPESKAIDNDAIKQNTEALNKNTESVQSAEKTSEKVEKSAPKQKAEKEPNRQTNDNKAEDAALKENTAALKENSKADKEKKPSGKNATEKAIEKEERKRKPEKESSGFSDFVNRAFEILKEKLPGSKSHDSSQYTGTGGSTKFSKSAAAGEAEGNLVRSMSSRDSKSYESIKKQTNNMMESLTESIVAGFGNMESADLLMKVETHTRKINRIISDSFIHGLGIPKEQVKLKVDELNRSLIKEITVGMAGKVKKGEIAHGPSNPAEMKEFQSVLGGDIALESLGPLIDKFKELDEEDTTGVIAKLSKLQELMFSVSDMAEASPEAIQHLFQTLERMSKDPAIKEFAPQQMRDIQDVTQRVYRDISSTEPGAAINVVNNTRSDVAQQQRVADFDLAGAISALSGITGAISSFVDNLYDVE
ncbi:MAG: hypothetical protein ACRC6B_07115, partial [Fusobacteriaceae bacterium]